MAGTKPFPPLTDDDLTPAPQPLPELDESPPPQELPRRTSEVADYSVVQHELHRQGEHLAEMEKRLSDLEDRLTIDFGKVFKDIRDLFAKSERRKSAIAQVKERANQALEFAQNAFAIAKKLRGD